MEELLHEHLKEDFDPKVKSGVMRGVERSKLKQNLSNHPRNSVDVSQGESRSEVADLLEGLELSPWRYAERALKSSPRPRTSPAYYAEKHGSLTSLLGKYFEDRGVREVERVRIIQRVRVAEGLRHRLKKGNPAKAFS